MKGTKASEPPGKRSAGLDVKAECKLLLRDLRAGESGGPAILAWSLLAGVLILLPFYPLLSAVLLVQLIYSNPWRGRVNALMLTVTMAYAFFVYLSFANRWAAPYLQVAALSLALALGVLSQWRHRAFARSLYGRILDLERLSATDELTGLLCRRRFFDLAEKEFRGAGGSMVHSVLLVVLENLRDIEHMASAAGDAALLAAGAAVRDTLGPESFACRYRYDAFLILLAGTGESTAQETAAALRRNLSMAQTAGQNPLPQFSVRIGVATRTEYAPKLADLMAAAERALHYGETPSTARVGPYGREVLRSGTAAPAARRLRSGAFSRAGLPGGAADQGTEDFPGDNLD